MKKNVNINYKKDGRLNYGRVNLGTDINEILKVSPENNEVCIEFKDNELIVEPVVPNIVEQVSKIKDELIYMKGISKLSQEKNKNSFKFVFPNAIIKKWELEKEKVIDMNVYENKIIFKPYQMQEETMVNKQILNVYSPEYIRTVISVITVKVEKGGIGKTLFTCMIGTGLALAGYRVFIFTTDPQNNVLDMLLKSKEEGEIKTYYTFDKKEFVLDKKTKGLKYWLKNETGEIVKLRENLDFIPLESPLDGNKKFEENIGKLLYKLKDSYDFVLIDSVPTKSVDEVILKYTKRLVMPAAGDKLTMQGITRVIRELGANKISAIIFNKYLDTVVEKAFYTSLKKEIEGKGIYYPEPIKQLTAISQLVHKSKSIWESQDKKIVPVQLIMKELLKKLILDCSKKEEL